MTARRARPLRKIIDQYKQVIYLDAAGKPIRAQHLLAVLAQRIVGFTMTCTQVEGKAASMTLQLAATTIPPTAG